MIAFATASGDAGEARVTDSRRGLESGLKQELDGEVGSLGRVGMQ